MVPAKPENWGFLAGQCGRLQQSEVRSPRKSGAVKTAGEKYPVVCLIEDRRVSNLSSAISGARPAGGDYAASGRVNSK
jgi:hypothetical protein